jgi:hypothetical protein
VAEFAKEDQMIQSHINAIIEHPSESAALAYSLSSLIAQRRQRADSMIADLKTQLDEADRSRGEDSHAIALIRELHPKNDDQTYRNAVLEIIGNENRREKPVCSAAFCRLSELAKGLPKGLRSDWDGTNHFELTSDAEEYWWLFLLEGLDDIDDPMESDRGKRIGLIMDIAAEVANLRDHGLLGWQDDR